MQTDSAQATSAHTEAGSVVGLWRYPVKSMMGEELNAAEVTERGLVGDRHFAVVDASTGKVAGAKNPRKWGNFFELVDERPRRGLLGREVAFAEAKGDEESTSPTAEEYWPDLEGLDFRDTVTDFDLPAGTFFDIGVVHLLTTATIDRLRELYPQGRFEVRRFRPNIVVATEPEEQGFVENDWIGRTVAIGDKVRLRITGPCPRCVMTTLAQGDLPKDSGILRTAAQHNHANVGVYADVVEGGAIQRGDPVTLV